MITIIGFIVQVILAIVLFCGLILLPLFLIALIFICAIGAILAI